jgi:hypothetical protein
MKITAVQWWQHVESWRSSGLSQAAYCRQHGLNAKSFSRWIRKQLLRNSGDSLTAIVGTLDNNDNAQFIPIRVTGDVPAPNSSGIAADRSWSNRTQETPVTAATLTLRVHGNELVLSTAVQPGWLAELLRCLA